jgi:hypothetical protein
MRRLQVWSEGCINKWGWGNVKTIVQGLIEDRGAEGVWKLDHVAIKKSAIALFAFLRWIAA